MNKKFWVQVDEFQLQKKVDAGTYSFSFCLTVLHLNLLFDAEWKTEGILATFQICILHFVNTSKWKFEENQREKKRKPNFLLLIILILSCHNV